ncbi:MAG: class I SAM-dependent methyltransferase [Desulfobacterales bacterium]|nr:class I SAM-dependent methyltransferase [Desulfobacterales bacterium]
MAQYVGWISRESQYANFDVASDLAGVHWAEVKDVLDVGCGFGGLVGYLRKEKGFRGEYLGIDVVGEFIEKAKDAYGDDPGNRFMKRNILDGGWFGRRFEIIISIGGLSINHDHPHRYGEKSRLYAKTFILGIAERAASAMSIYFPNEENFYAPGENLEMAFYQPRDIEAMIRDACKDRFDSMTFTSYPDPDNLKTMARVYLK